MKPSRIAVTYTLIAGFWFTAAIPVPGAETKERPGAWPQRVLKNSLEFQAYVAENPDSYLAKGCKAYEAISDDPYFGPDIDRFDPARFKPETEIEKWPAFIAAYSRHPGADDAAYRLGRCYEILNKPGKRLNGSLKPQPFRTAILRKQRGEGLFSCWILS